MTALQDMTLKEFLVLLVKDGKMWSWTYLRDCVDAYSEEDCQGWRDIIIEKWLIYHMDRWEDLLYIASLEKIKSVWLQQIKSGGDYYQYANNFYSRIFCSKADVL